MSLYSKIIDLQKLGAAWQKVYGNKPASGADHVTCEAFEANKTQELKQLNLELKELRYQVSPVKLVALKKEEKVREVSLYTMRDKTVQTSVARELTAIYEPAFPPCACAYRSERSALQAVGEVEAAAVSGKYNFAVKTDVRHFFDTISLEKLREFLERKIHEKEVLDLIFQILQTPSIDGDGSLTEKTVGIYQGSAISPVLSNIYMTEFDRELEQCGCFYIRYADDILLLTDTFDRAREVLQKTETLLSGLSLELNREKTAVRQLEDGFEFLGYAFNRKGRQITQKAKEKLENSLEDLWLSLRGRTITERLEKGSQILNGWEQYFHGDRNPANIFEYAVLLYMVRNRPEAEKLAAVREKVENSYKDIARYLIGIWEERQETDLVLFEYEQYYRIAAEKKHLKSEPLRREILGIYEELFTAETEELWTSLLQAYADAGEYDRSEKALQHIRDMREFGREADRVRPDPEDMEPVADEQSTALMLELLAGREDMYTREILTDGKRRRNEFVPEPLTEEVLKSHLSGRETLGTYLVRNNNTAHYMLFDIDISRRFLMEENQPEGVFAEHLQHAAAAAADLRAVIHELGLCPYLEFSGYRGYHLWIFFMEWIPVKYIYSLEEIILDRLVRKTLPEDVTVEALPSKNRKNSGSSGQTIKLPYGLHLQSGRRSCFLREDFTPISNVTEALSSLAKYTLDNVKRVIGAHIAENTEEKRPQERREITLDYEKLPGISLSVRTVLEKCSLMRYLVSKAMNTGYLTHFERQSILYVFGHIGEDGKDFVHTVMAFTMNYQYFITQKFINRIPEKPVSCIKLREQYKQITAECGCSCSFKRTKNCYPSPVIHALRENDEDDQSITIPTSRKITGENREKAYEELNVHTSLKGLTEKLIELSRQRRGIEKGLKKVETELCRIFDNAGVDCMEVELGMLVRRRTEKGYEWVIEM